MVDINSKRRGRISAIENAKAKFKDGDDSRKKIIKCVVPLSEMVGYSNKIRSLTRGKGTFSMQFSHFEYVGS